MRKRDAIKIEKKIISQASTTDTSLLTASGLVSLQLDKCGKPYSIFEDLIKPSLIAACNEVLGQSAAFPCRMIQLKARYLIWQKDTETLVTEKI